MAWQRLELVVEGAHAAALGDALEEAGALATEISDADAGTPDEQAVFGEPGADAGLWPRCRVAALFPAEADLANARDEAIAASGATILGDTSVERIESRDWVVQAQRQFAPLRVGERLWIVPTWHAPPDPGAINVALDPGAAFGTGTHPTTRLCLAWLERTVRGGESVLDYGCGSGILGITAMKLGAARATAVDVDPLALETARYNALRNGVALDVCDAQVELDLRAQLTVANILANPLRMLAPAIAAHTEPGGSIALSGILTAQADDVAQAYAPWAALGVEGEEGGWVLLAGKRRG